MYRTTHKFLCLCAWTHKWSQHSVSSETVQAQAAGKQTLPCGGRKGQSRTGQCREVVCFLVMQTRIRSRWDKERVMLCVCAHTHTYAHRNRQQWLQSRQCIWSTFSHVQPERWEVCLACLCVLGLCLLIWLTLSRMGGVIVSGCWDTRAAEHTWLLTEFSNRLCAVDLNALVALGGQGAHFLNFPFRQLCRLHFHCIKANTQSKWYEGF